jgi:hypothetical protein
MERRNFLKCLLAMPFLKVGETPDKIDGAWKQKIPSIQGTYLRMSPWVHHVHMDTIIEVDSELCLSTGGLSRLSDPRVINKLRDSYWFGPIPQVKEK